MVLVALTAYFWEDGERGGCIVWNLRERREPSGASFSFVVWERRGLLLDGWRRCLVQVPLLGHAVTLQREQEK